MSDAIAYVPAAASQHKGSAAFCGRVGARVRLDEAIMRKITLIVDDAIAGVGKGKSGTEHIIGAVVNNRPNWLRTGYYITGARDHLGSVWIHGDVAVVKSCETGR